MITIIKSSYHRNGVAGVGFYCIQFEYSRLKNVQKLIATGCTFPNKFDPEQFRVINPDNIQDAQRGDVWADNFNELFRESGYKTIFDWLGQYDEMYIEYIKPNRS